MRSAEILVGLLGAVTVLAGVARRIGLPSPIVLVGCGVLVGLVPGLPAVTSTPTSCSSSSCRRWSTAPGSTRRHATCARRRGGSASWPSAWSRRPTVAVAAAIKLRRARLRLAGASSSARSSRRPTRSRPSRSCSGCASRRSCRRSSRASRWSTTAPASCSTGWRSARPSAARSRSLDGAWQLVGHRRRRRRGRPGGRLARRPRARAGIDDAPIEITLSLFTPYAAYIAAEASACRASWRPSPSACTSAPGPRGCSRPTARIEAQGFWNALIFILESSLFLLMGLQIRDVAAGIENLDAGRVTLTVAVTLLVVLGRAGGLDVHDGPAPAPRCIPGEPEGEPPDMGPARGWSPAGRACAAPCRWPRRWRSRRRSTRGDPFPQRTLIVFTVFSVIVLGPAAAGPDAAGADPRDGPGPRRGRRRRRRGARPRRGGRGGARAPGPDGARRRRGGPRDRAPARALRGAPGPRARAPGRARRRRPPARRGLRARCARSCCAPSARRCTSCTPAARSREDALRTVERDLDLQEARLD